MKADLNNFTDNRHGRNHKRVGSETWWVGVEVRDPAVLKVKGVARRAY